ncbi:DUF6188 family protein [Williamsia sterculiae]|uniref:Uncharacterized protein n=1 Tax=Williamsia sterculiae TaxID=1344003 RepID=A0A1N7DGK8_9NOCA|nr:DUF6188 family protein [Williamsia sterculiae]SIR75029.1 hypothetical protein SAMN05445060_0623 [Williamsia sterculiae]
MTLDPLQVGMMVHEVTRNAFQLEIGFSDDIAVIAEAGLRLVTSDGDVHHYAGDVTELESLESLVGTLLSSVQLSPRGLLTLNFDSGDSVAVSPHPDAEGWNICDAEGVRVVCLPGGAPVQVNTPEYES